MNNAQLIIKEFVGKQKDPKPILQEKVEQLSETIDALQNVGGSSFWKVLQKNIWSVELNKAKKSLAKSDDTNEMFRLQGELRWEDKFNLEKLIEKYRNELEIIKQKLNE